MKHKIITGVCVPKDHLPEIAVNAAEAVLILYKTVKDRKIQEFINEVNSQKMKK